MQPFYTIHRVFLREARRIAERRSYRALLILLPASAMVIFGALFVRPVTGLPIALLDGDHSPSSRQLARMVDATAGVDIRYDIQSIDEGKHLIRSGKARALILIPKGFEGDLLALRQPTVALYNSGANLTTNGIIEREVQSAVQTFGVGVQLQLLNSVGITGDEAMAVARPISFVSHALFNPYLDYAAYLAPTFMAMTLLIFTVLTTIYAVGSELKESTASEWLDTAEGSIVVALVGKLSLPMVAMLLWGGVMFYILFVLLGVPMSGSFGMLALATALFIVSYQAVGLFFVALFDNMRMALSIGGGYSVLSFSFSGVTFPAMAMYAPIRAMSNIFPFTFYTKIYVDLAVRGAPVTFALQPMAALLLFWLLPIATLPRLERMCRNPRYWGKS